MPMSLQGQRTEGGKVEWRGRRVGVGEWSAEGRRITQQWDEDGSRSGECTAQEQRLKVDSEHSNSM